jgi:hypothetical protein
MPPRHEVIQKILTLLPGYVEQVEAERTWFYDVRKKGGWRLTKSGLAAMKMAGIQHWRVDLDLKKVNQQLILEMNRKIQSPYFISTRPPELWLFSDREAVMAQLYGEIPLWLKSLD